MECAQVAKLRAALRDKLAGSQVVYVEVKHWTHFPDVRWNLLLPAEQLHLGQHFSGCGAMEPYIRGGRTLPPPVPGTAVPYV